jgi:hypothetical protein
MYGEGKGVYRVLVGKSEGKRVLGRPRLRWEDIIKADLQKVGCGAMEMGNWQNQQSTSLYVSSKDR